MQRIEKAPTSRTLREHRNRPNFERETQMHTQSPLARLRAHVTERQKRTAALLSIVLFVSPAFAQTDQELKQRVQALEAEVNQLKALVTQMQSAGTINA